jgi:hypothetical protein
MARANLCVVCDCIELKQVHYDSHNGSKIVVFVPKRRHVTLHENCNDSCKQSRNIPIQNMLPNTEDMQTQRKNDNILVHGKATEKSPS